MDSLLLMLIEKGSMRIEYRGQKYTALPGEIVLMGCTYPQYYDTSDYVEFYWMHISGINCFDLCLHLTHTRGSIVHRTEGNDEADRLIRCLLLQYADNQSVSDAEQSRALYSILCLFMPDTTIFAPISRKYLSCTQGCPVHSTAFGRGLESQAYRCRSTSQPIPSHLIRVFYAEMQRSPHEYIGFCEWIVQSTC